VETSEGAYSRYEIVCELVAPSAVYPVANDVRNNVDYGPTGADYNGDLVSPAVGDVKVGVGYGADGTEYTGTYSPPTGATAFAFI
jgi:hypothetical protein